MKTSLPSLTIANRSLGTVLMALSLAMTAHRAEAAATESAANLALVAVPSTSFVSGHETITALNDGFTPENSDDKSHGAYGNWPRTGTQWVQYDWSQPISTTRMEVYWFDDNRGVRLPKACRLKYWNGTAFVEVPNVTGLGLNKDKFNASSFPEITTAKLRLEIDGTGSFSTGILDWRVYDSGKSPNFPPSVDSGVDRVVILPGKTYLSGTVKDDGKPKSPPNLQWSKLSGPGIVTFESPHASDTAATFSAPGDYILKLSADDGQSIASSALSVKVEPPLPASHLEPVWTISYKVSSPFWRPRIRNTIVNWIPHCVAKIEDPSLKEGGLENFVQAANKLAGRDARHVGAPFANAWVFNTLESMCLATMVDPQGDESILKAQQAMRKTIEAWIPKILAAQEPDGYLHTMYTINQRPRWSNKFDHEGYNAGYFLEAAIAHYLATGGDSRLVDAAKRLADCWYDNIGPSPKRSWYEGHEEMEQALVRFSRFIEQKDGPGKGRKYVELAKFLLDSRKNGEEYDQSHLPVTHQYEAVGHAVRAVYCYSGMADVAMETGDVDYYSAVKSLWHSIVDRKYYITGGVGSGETSEGFGKEYSLPNRAYCESCAGCGELFFEHKMQLAFQDSRYADLSEETLYNAILGGMDLEAQNFTYTNPLDSGERRYKWHGCPCCVGNIPRTLLMAPTWMYSKDAATLCVNMFMGSTVNVGHVAGTPVEVVQTTDYPWRGNISIVINPSQPARFTLKVRVPRRDVSSLYSASPICPDLTSVAVNGSQIKPRMENGYLTITRKWKAGDSVSLVLPLQVQRVKAIPFIPSTRGKVALRYGPLIYNIESVDQPIDGVLSPASPLTSEWKQDLLGGVMVIKGKFTNGQSMMAIPNYARLNRGGRSIVWIKDE